MSAARTEFEPEFVTAAKDNGAGSASSRDNNSAADSSPG
jgi:hypothetical protein